MQGFEQAMERIQRHGCARLGCLYILVYASLSFALGFTLLRFS
jgi:hypothetical protein